MASISGSLAGSIFCDECGQEFAPKEPVCAGCGVVPTRQWFQLMSLCTLLVAVTCNSAVAWLLLPRLVHVHRPATRIMFRLWLWLDINASIYGWIPIIVGLLVWHHFIWERAKLRGTRPKVQRWVTKKLLTFVLAAAVTPMIPWWIPAGQAPDQFLSMIGKYPGLPSTLAWVATVFVLTLLCLNVQTRDSLLGRGRVLSLVSLGALLIVLTITLLGWSLTY